MTKPKIKSSPLSTLEQKVRRMRLHDLYTVAHKTLPRKPVRTYVWVGRVHIGGQPKTQKEFLAAVKSAFQRLKHKGATHCALYRCDESSAEGYRLQNDREYAAQVKKNDEARTWIRLCRKELKLLQSFKTLSAKNRTKALKAMQNAENR